MPGSKVILIPQWDVAPVIILLYYYYPLLYKSDNNNNNDSRLNKPVGSEDCYYSDILL